MDPSAGAEGMDALSGSNVIFCEAQGIAQVRAIHLFGVCPENFEFYRKDARALIRVITGEGATLEEDQETVGVMALNAMGVNTFLAALAYEVCEQNYQCNIPHGASCQYCGKELHKNASRDAIEDRDCGECAED
jgi:hypothetical protein